jgi:hypothetical protein
MGTRYEGEALIMAAPASPLLDAARAWYDAGFCVIPSHEDGGKRPFGQWKKYQEQRPDWTALEGWLASGRYTGIGLIMGQASGNAEMLEIEGPSDLIAGRVSQLFDAARSFDMDGDLGLVELVERVYHGCSEVSAGGGLHMFLRITDGPVPGNTKLAMDSDKVIAETRGEGGFVIVWPTPARIGHKPSEAYLLLPNAHPSRAAQVTATEHQWLHSIFSDAFGGLPERPAPATPAPEHRPASTDLSPFDDYRQRTTWRDILEPAGWTWHSRDHDHDYWTRPGKEPRDGHSASTIEDGPFYLFSTSVAGMPVEVGLSKAQVYAHLHHDGDLSNATRQLRADGYGEDLTTNVVSLSEFIANMPDTAQADERERTSWWPRDITGVINGNDTEPDPTHLTRGDGPAMFYSGRVNGLIGESESGKTWVALHATHQDLAAGGSVVYLDFEDSAAGIINRLRIIGAREDTFARLTYIAPDETLSTQAKADLAETLVAARPTLVILDGFNAAMTLMGLDINSNNDATHFAQQLLKPIAATGTCVVYVDHVPKSREARGKGGIGAQAKRAMTTGCALTVTVTEPFGQGQAGRLHLTVDKDRPGRVRAHSYAAKHAGDVILTPQGKGMKITIQPSDRGADTGEEEAKAQRQILEFVRKNPGASQNRIEQNVTGKGVTLRGRLEYLVHLGKLQVISNGAAKRYHFIEDLEALPPFEVVEDE